MLRLGFIAAAATTATAALAAMAEKAALAALAAQATVRLQLQFNVLTNTATFLPAVEGEPRGGASQGLGSQVWM